MKPLGLSFFFYFISIYCVFSQTDSVKDSIAMSKRFRDYTFTIQDSTKRKIIFSNADSSNISFSKDSLKRDTVSHKDTLKKPKRFQLGLATGIEQTAFQFDISNLGGTADKLKKANASNFTGFTLGLSGIYKLSKYWDLVGEGDFNFRSSELVTDTTPNALGIDRFKIAEFRIPIHIKYTMRQLKFPPNIALGLDMGWKFNGNTQTQILQFNPFNSYVDIIFGFEFKLWRITINPGLNYSIGLNSIIKPGSIFDNTLNSLRENRIGINFHVF